MRPGDNHSSPQSDAAAAAGRIKEDLESEIIKGSTLLPTPRQPPLSVPSPIPHLYRGIAHFARVRTVLTLEWLARSIAGHMAY
jgi:hypothetical protein